MVWLLAPAPTEVIADQPSDPWVDPLDTSQASTLATDREQREIQQDMLTTAIAEAVFNVEPTRGPTPPEPTALIEAVRGISFAYFFEGADGFIRTFESGSVSPPPTMSSPEQLRTLWESRSVRLDRAKLDFASAEIWPRVWRGERVKHEGRSQAEQVISRPTRAPALADPEANGLTVYEVLFTGEFMSARGVRFKAKTGFFFTFDPDSGEWIMTHSVIRDRPDGIATLALPI